VPLMVLRRSPVRDAGKVIETHVGCLNAGRTNGWSFRHCLRSSARRVRQMPAIEIRAEGSCVGRSNGAQMLSKFRNARDKARITWASPEIGEEIIAYLL